MPKRRKTLLGPDPKLDRIAELAAERARVEAELAEAVAAARDPSDDPWWLHRPRSWPEIGRCLGVTGEAVRQRYRHLDPQVRAQEARARRALLEQADEAARQEPLDDAG